MFPSLPRGLSWQKRCVRAYSAGRRDSSRAASCGASPHKAHDGARTINAACSVSLSRGRGGGTMPSPPLFGVQSSNPRCREVIYRVWTVGVHIFFCRCGTTKTQLLRRLARAFLSLTEYRGNPAAPQFCTRRPLEGQQGGKQETYPRKGFEGPSRASCEPHGASAA